MSDTRISAADLLRLAAIASVSPEGSADEVVAILQRTGPDEDAPAAEPAPIVADATEAREIMADRLSAFDANLTGGDADADPDKLAKPE